MRHRRVEATAGVVDARSLIGRRMLTRLAVLLVAIWVAWAVAQEAWTANRLAAQASELRQRNAALQAQNADYRRDIGTVQSGAAAEEVARSSGYSRQDEKVYVVSSPAAPAPIASPSVAVQQTSPSFGDALRAWWSGLFGRRG